MFAFFRKRSKSSRNLFRYWDGGKWRYADPIATYRAIMGHETYRVDLHPRLVEEGDLEALNISLQATRDVLDVSAWSEENPTGLPELQTLELFVQFFDFVETIKKNTVPTPTLQPPTEPAISENSSEPITSDTSPSGSPSVDLNSDKQIERVSRPTQL